MRQTNITFWLLLLLQIENYFCLSTTYQKDLAVKNNQHQLDIRKDGMKILSRKRRFLIFPTGSSFSVAVCMTVGVYGNPQFSIWSWGLNYGFAYNLPTNSTEYTNIPPDIQVYPFVNYDDDEPSTTTTTTTPAPPPPESHESHDSHETHDSHEAFTDLPAPSSDDKTHRRQFYTYYRPSWETQPMMHRRYRRDVYRNIETIIDKMGHSGRDCVLKALCESSIQFKNKKKRTMIQEMIKTVFTMPKSNVLPFEHPDLSIYDQAYRNASIQASCETSYSKCGFSIIKLILGKYSKLQNFM
ncbi:hypothetical protein PVAND_002545 [Polypedilum vanderplanki]|uniref:Uncharacterized protein n=1 Tax=Polypedilum vanderplanki TaxID=319348 RepID=A0A9J6BSW6_POLVA|nr:hypothetical protein PVAND_002545 [Polypedilum vanderplanki]